MREDPYADCEQMQIICAAASELLDAPRDPLFEIVADFIAFQFRVFALDRIRDATDQRPSRQLVFDEAILRPLANNFEGEPRIIGTDKDHHGLVWRRLYQAGKRLHAVCIGQGEIYQYHIHSATGLKATKRLVQPMIHPA